MIDFILATAPANLAQVKAFLVARGIINAQANPDGSFSGTLPGFEYTVQGIPNPLPSPYNTLRIFLFRISHDMEDDQVAGDVTPDTDNFTKAKIVKWVKANGTPAQITSPDGWSVNVWRVMMAGVPVYLTNDIGHIGTWQ